MCYIRPYISQFTVTLYFFVWRIQLVQSIYNTIGVHLENKKNILYA